MALLTVIDVLMMVVGGVGIIYQAICVIMSLFSKPVHFPDAPMDKRYAVLI
ncbi:N-acetylglucosaminyltransferase, partial [Bifidobacterium bifidum]|nr:N-acetylglucosaminyltransferase [Bifidobacterium bifidum]